MRTETTQPTTQLDEAGRGDWRVIVDSIGEAGAGLVGALKWVSPLPESRLAELLYQAPSQVASDLDLASARQLQEVLQGAGLESRVLAADQAFEAGDCDHEIALVVHDCARVLDVVRLVVDILGVDLHQARRMLCATPTVLLGRISASTAQTLRRRFEALGGVEVDISCTQDATYDLLLGSGGVDQRTRVVRELARLGHPIEELADGQVLSSGLRRPEAEELWQMLSRTGGVPARLINRDFERFDLCLESASASAELERFLVDTAGIPERLVAKVVARLPIVTHHRLRRADLDRHLECLTSLGARATGHPLSLRFHGLRIEALGDAEASIRILRALTELDEEAADRALRVSREVVGPLTYTQARWLRWQLAQIGTQAKVRVR